VFHGQASKFTSSLKPSDCQPFCVGKHFRPKKNFEPLKSLYYIFRTIVKILINIVEHLGLGTWDTSVLQKKRLGTTSLIDPEQNIEK
jgi:hypothetical protein